MSEHEKRIYELIRRHYLAQFLSLREIYVRRLSLNIGGQLFKVFGRVVVVPGWKRLFSPHGENGHRYVEEKEDQALPMLSKGDNCVVIGTEVKALKTKPP